MRGSRCSASAASAAMRLKRWRAAASGALDLIDDDKVCLTNLNRQIIATHDTLGQYKVDAFAARIAAINPAAVVRTYKVFFGPQTADQFDFSRYDYVVDAIDTVSAKVELAVCAQEAGRAGHQLDGGGQQTGPHRICCDGSVQDLGVPACARNAHAVPQARRAAAEGRILAGTTHGGRCPRRRCAGFGARRPCAPPKPGVQRFCPAGSGLDPGRGGHSGFGGVPARIKLQKGREKGESQWPANCSHMSRSSAA